MFANGLSIFITFNTHNNRNHEPTISILQIKLQNFNLPKLNLCPHHRKKKLEFLIANIDI